MVLKREAAFWTLQALRSHKCHLASLAFLPFLNSQVFMGDIWVMRDIWVMIEKKELKYGCEGVAADSLMTGSVLGQENDAIESDPR